MAIEQVFPEGARPSDRVYSNGEQPPLFVVATAYEEDEGHSVCLDGPMNQDQLDLAMSIGDRMMSDDERALTEQKPSGYEVNVDFQKVPQNYPGGIERASLLLAKFAFGVE